MNGLATRQALESIADSCAPGTQAPPLHGFEPFDLGTPREAERRRAAKRERVYRGACKVAIWVVLLLCGAATGYHARRHPPAPPPPIDTNIEYRQKAAALPAGSQSCTQSIREGCPRQSFVCLYKQARGQTSVVWHC